MTIKKTGGAICAVSAVIAIVLSMDSGLRINREGLELIGNAEACRREPYMCPARVLTVGIGSTGNVQNRRYSDTEIAEMWITDLRAAEKCVNQYANGQAMNVNQFSAITSFTFNAGCGNLQKSTLARYAQRQQWPEMCAQLKRWVYIGSEESRGLKIRRVGEYQLCMKQMPKSAGFVPDVDWFILGVDSVMNPVFIVESDE